MSIFNNRRQKFVAWGIGPIAGLVALWAYLTSPRESGDLWWLLAAVLGLGGLVLGLVLEWRHRRMSGRGSDD